MHLKLHTFKNDSSYLFDSEQIVTDYIEKLIQIPYRIPKLSPSEIESYKNLLFCQNHLETEEFKLVYEKYTEFKQKEFYTAYSLGHIKAVINLDDKVELQNLLHISNIMSRMITNILKGNPRQTKRFLNTFILRQKLAKVAKIEINYLILIKLMLLEYFNIKLFNKLNDLQSNNNGLVKELQALESVYCDGEDEKAIEKFQEWTNDKIQNWIKLEPRIGEEDLRDYFWLARDKTGSTLSNVHMVNPHIQKIYKGLISDKDTIVVINLEGMKEFNDEEISEVLNLFENNIHSLQDIKIHLISLYKVAIQVNQFSFYERYLSIIQNIPYFKIKKLAFLSQNLQMIGMKEKKLLDSVKEQLNKYVDNTGLLSKSSIKVLEKINK